MKGTRIATGILTLLTGIFMSLYFISLIVRLWVQYSQTAWNFNMGPQPIISLSILLGIIVAVSVFYSVLGGLMFAKNPKPWISITIITLNVLALMTLGGYAFIMFVVGFFWLIFPVAGTITSLILAIVYLTQANREKTKNYMAQNPGYYQSYPYGYPPIAQPQQPMPQQQNPYQNNPWATPQHPSPNPTYGQYPPHQPLPQQPAFYVPQPQHPNQPPKNS